MTTHEDQTEIEVWETPVPIDKWGSRRWPHVIKSMAAERIAAGARISDIAKETCANDCTVRKWLSRAGGPMPPKLGFIKVNAPVDELEHGRRFTKSQDRGRCVW